MKNKTNSSRNGKPGTEPAVVFTTSAYNKVTSTLGALSPMKGCVLLGYRGESYNGAIVIRDIIFDKSAKTTRTSYTIDHVYLNKELGRLNSEKGLRLLGMGVSHTKRIFDHTPVSMLFSCSEKSYFYRLQNTFHCDRMVFPIIHSADDGGKFEIRVHVKDLNDYDPHPVNYSVVEDSLIPPYEVTKDENGRKEGTDW